VSANVVQALVWLFFAIGMFAYFREPVRQFMRQAAELTIKAGPGGIEVTMKRQLIEANATLAVAEVAKQTGVSATSELSPTQVANIVNIVDSAITPQTAKRLSDARLLWVDDRPANNTYERQAFDVPRDTHRSRTLDERGTGETPR
jgi:hypothetical protein